MNCPECGAAWPEHLQHEHDMLEVTTFRIEPDGSIGVYPGEPTYLDNTAWYCSACLKDVSAHMVTDDRYRPVIDAIESL